MHLYQYLLPTILFLSMLSNNINLYFLIFNISTRSKMKESSHVRYCQFGLEHYIFLLRNYHQFHINLLNLKVLLIFIAYFYSFLFNTYFIHIYNQSFLKLNRKLFELYLNLKNYSKDNE